MTSGFAKDGVFVRYNENFTGEVVFRVPSSNIQKDETYPEYSEIGVPADILLQLFREHQIWSSTVQMGSPEVREAWSRAPHPDEWRRDKLEFVTYGEEDEHGKMTLRPTGEERTHYVGDDCPGGHEGE